MHSRLCHSAVELMQGNPAKLGCRQREMNPKYPVTTATASGSREMLWCLTPQQALQGLLHPATLRPAVIHATGSCKEQNYTRYGRLLLTLQWDLEVGINPVTLHLHVIGTLSFKQCLYLHFSSPAEVKSNSEF